MTQFGILYCKTMCPHISSIGLQARYERRDCECLKLLHNLMSDLRYSLKISFLSPDQMKSTKNNHRINPAPFQPRTNMFSYSFFPRSIEKWNSLPAETRSLPRVRNVQFTTATDTKTRTSFIEYTS